MPHMSGSELVRRFPSVPVLYMSGYPDDTLVQHGALKGEIELLSKPFSANELTCRVSAILRESRTARTGGC